MAENSDNKNIISTNRRRILQYVTERIIPFQEVDIEDAVITVSGMVKAGLINLDNVAAATTAAAAATKFEADEETRKITRLVLARSSNNEAQQQQQQDQQGNNNNNNWQLPIDIICRLELLERLDLSFCGSTSPSTTMMQRVRSQRRQKRNSNLCFNNLKRLDLQYTFLQHNGGEDNIGSDSLSEEEHSCLFDFLPNLQCIKFGCYDGETIDNVIRDIKVRCIFLNNLQNISFTYSEFNEGHLETFLFDILPEASKLTTLDLWSNQIQSVKRIAARCIEGQQQQHYIALHCLDLHCNPVLEISQTDPVERAALMTLLCTFKGISNLGACHAKQYHSDVEYLLQINNAGRGRLVEGDIDSKPIPINLWPTVLERAYNKSNQIYGKDFRYGKEKSHVGLFYLIRHGPVLEHIYSRRIQNE